MSDISQAVENLIDAIHESNEYGSYQGYLEQLNRYPELKQRVDEYRERNFELQQSGQDENSLMVEMDRFEQDYENGRLRSDPLVHKFLASELSFCRMMQDIFTEIMENIHFD